VRPGRLALALWECDRHADVLGQALQRWSVLEPAASLERIESEPDLRQLADQILFRFMKLQDAMGERLVSASLEALAEPYEDRPMRDRLDRLEKLGYLDVQDWLRWRELRNRLAHEYPDAPEVRMAQLRAAMAAAGALRTAYLAWAGRMPRT
jgi:hypothetical protein